MPAVLLLEAAAAAAVDEDDAPVSVSVQFTPLQLSAHMHVYCPVVVFVLQVPPLRHG
jgi:hypothetical protein